MDQTIDMSRVSNRMIVITVLVRGIIVSVISFYIHLILSHLTEVWFRC